MKIGRVAPHLVRNYIPFLLLSIRENMWLVLSFYPGSESDREFRKKGRRTLSK